MYMSLIYRLKRITTTETMHNISVDKKPTRSHFVLSFISPLQVAQHVSDNHAPIFRS